MPQVGDLRGVLSPDFTFVDSATIVAVVPPLPPGSAPIQIQINVGGTSDPFPFEVRGFVTGSEFIRGDCNDDGSFDIGDAVFLLASLFVMGPFPSCDDACDANDDGLLNIADAVYKLAALFSMGPPPPPPHPGCGVDPTADGLDCGSYGHCP